jgi:hypothetical protein
MVFEYLEVPGSFEPSMTTTSAKVVMTFFLALSGYGLGIVDDDAHVEGFVVLEIPINPNQPQVSLDVIGTYTARAFTGEVSSLDGPCSQLAKAR